MSGFLPDCAFQSWMAGRKRPGCPLTMYPHLAELGMIPALNQIVADLIDQLQLAAKYLSKRLSHLFKDHEAIDDGKVAARRNGVQVVAVVLRLRSKKPEVDVSYDVRLFSTRQLKIVSSQSVPPAARSSVSLDKNRTGFLAALKLDKVVSASKRPHLLDASFGPPFPSERRLPIAVDRHTVALGSAPVKSCSIFINVVFGAASDEVVEFAAI